MMTLVFFTLWNADATAPPVSPDVATSMVRGLDGLSWWASFFTRYDMRRAMNLAPKSLNARVGPWKSSRMYD